MTLTLRLCVLAAALLGVTSSGVQAQSAYPTPPNGLVATNMGDGQRAHVTWSDNSTNETGFELVRERNVGVQWIEQVTLTTGANVPELMDTPGTGFFRYRVRAVNSAGGSVYSIWTQVSVVLTLPNLPTGLEAIDLGDGLRAQVRWTDTSNNESGFEILRQKESASNVWGNDKTLIAPANTQVLNNVPGPGTFRYRIRSVNQLGGSVWSAWVIGVVAPVNPGGGGTSPLAPSDVGAINLGTGVGVQVNWTDNSDNEDGFTIQRQWWNGSIWGAMATFDAPPDAESRIDTLPAPNALWRYRVRAYNDIGESDFTPWVEVSAVLTAPTVPTDLAFRDLGDGLRSELTWTDRSNNESGFELLREKQNASGQWFGTTTLTAGANVQLIWNMPGPGTFRYRIRAVNSAGSSAYSAWVVGVIEETPPAAPSGFAAVSLGNGVQTRLNWTDNSGNESEFEIERQTQSGASWGPTATLQAAANAETLTDGPGAGTHRYRIRAVNAIGASAFSAWETATVDAVPPAAPTGIAAVSLSNNTHIRVTWQDNSTTETGFELERQTLAGAVWGPVATLSVSANTTQHDDPAGVGTHRYRARAVNAAGASAFTGWVSATIASPLPSAPTNIAAAAINNGAQARVTWQDNSNNETGFQLERQTLSGAVWGPASTINVSANVTQHDDAPGVGTHRYRVRAANVAGSSSWTGYVSIVLNPTIPAAPSGLAAYDAGNRRAMVTWQDNSSNETRFDVERSPSFPGGVLAVSANVTGYLDQCGAGTFSYRLRAANASGASAWTGWVQVVVADILPVAPSAFSAVDLGNQQSTRLSWTDNADNETGFELERQTSTGGGNWGAVVGLTAAANAVTRDDTPGEGTHRYRIRAVNAIGPSAWTAWATVSVTSGWTVMTASPDTRVVYVSSSLGNDANTGLSEAFPKRTIAAGVAQLRAGFPDWLLLRRGDTWTSESLGYWNKGGRSETEPTVVASYGTSSERPFIRTGSGSAFACWSNIPQINHVWVVGLRFTPHTYTGTANHPDGFTYQGTAGTNILIEDCHFSGYRAAIILEGTVLTNLRVRRNIIVDSFVVGDNPHTYGMYVFGANGLTIEENVIDHNGWREDIPGAFANIFRHNVYLQTGNSGVVFRRNIVTSGGSHGVQARSGGIVEDNVFARNAISVLVGSDGGPATGVSGVVRGNAILEGTDIAGQPRGIAMEIQNINSQGILVEKNIIAHNLSVGNGIAITLTPRVIGILSATLRDNVIYNWRSGLYIPSPQAGASLSNVSWHSNIMHEPQSGGSALVNHLVSPLPASYSFQGNRYFSGGSTSNWFIVGGTQMNFAQWATAAGEVGSIAAPTTLVDPTRSLATYHGSLGRPATFAAFIAEARLQSRHNWRSEYTAVSILDYLRAGYSSNP